MSPLETFALKLVDELYAITFAAPVTHVYNPLVYAWRPHRTYLRRCQPQTTEVLLLGMNPGPWGMTQTGVPFGQVAAVRDWLQITDSVDQPTVLHPKRPIEGFNCRRSEVSGERLWGLFRKRLKTPSAFFERHFIINYCPLVFMESSGKNRTPDKLPLYEQAALQAACDRCLQASIEWLRPKFLVGVGAYAETCLQRVASAIEHKKYQPTIFRILHPSPASPAANRDWAGVATTQMIAGGAWSET